ncbi:uncharacterized protein LOC142467802 [Ascaphus truei]|uniref:uncharacterized protein LOC142467802 n=1 Tax=Ascaphus truei TaxID=8439 RepID=UPI003F591001
MSPALQTFAVLAAAPDIIIKDLTAGYRIPGKTQSTGSDPLDLFLITSLPFPKAQEPAAAVTEPPPHLQYVKELLSKVCVQKKITGRTKKEKATRHQPKVSYSMEEKLFVTVTFLVVCSNVLSLPVLEDTQANYGFVPTTSNPDQDITFKIVELPSEFNCYDLNKDGAISLEELSDITETLSDDAILPFNSADTDGKSMSKILGNYLLSEQEFKDAPWVFSIPEEISKPAKQHKEGHVVP